MDNMDRNRDISVPVRVDLETTVTISIIEDNFWGKRIGFLHHLPPTLGGEIVLFQSKPIPVQTTYDGAADPQMIKVGVKERRIKQDSFSTDPTSTLQLYLKNESQGDLHIIRGSVTKSYKRDATPTFTFGCNLLWDLNNVRIAPGDTSESPAPSLVFSPQYPYLGLEFKLTVGSSTEYCDPDDVKVVRNTLEKKSAHDLANCMSALWKRADNAADITLICQGKKFLAHKAILIGRSDVFSAMFNHIHTTEATTNEVRIDDTDHDTLERFLCYVYGGDLPGITFEDADHLMVLSDKYNVKGLMQVCSHVLMKKITVKNLYRAAILGYLCNDEVLKDAAMQKLVRSGKRIKEIDGWDELKKIPDLTAEILDFYSQSVKPGTCEPPPPKQSKVQFEV